MAVTDRAPLSEYVVRRDNGIIGAGASVRVLLPGTGTTTTIYTAQTGAGTTAQPLTADSRGRIPGWVVPRTDGYDLEVTIDGATIAVQRIRPSTPSDVSGLVVPAVHATRTAVQSIPNATETAIAFNATDIYDTDAMHSTVTNNTRLTVVLAGVYVISGQVALAADADGNRRLSIRKNGTDYLARTRQASAVSGAEMEATVSCQAKLAAADYVELTYIHSAGAATDIVATTYSPQFQATWLAAG